MKNSLFTVSLLCLISMTACHNGGHRAYEADSQPSFDTTSVSAGLSEKSASEPAMNASMPLSLNSPERKIIKTAELNARVRDVYEATTRLERLVSSIGGQIAQSNLDHTTEETRNLPYRDDSLRQLEVYTSTAHLTLRVPVIYLDTVLNDIAAGASFINNRNLRLDDVTLRMLSNKLKNEAMAANNAATRAKDLARKSTDAVYSGDYADERAETLIDRRIENMQLRDQVTFATLTVDLAQPQRVSQTIIPDVERMMQPTIGDRIRTALGNGWQLLRELCIGLLQVWPLLLAACGVLYFIRWKRARRNINRPAITA